MSVCGESMTTSGGAGTTLPSANSSTFPDVLYTPASLIGSELSVYLAPAFIMRVLLAALYWGTGSSSTNAAFTLPCCALRGTSGGETMTSPGGAGISCLATTTSVLGWRRSPGRKPARRRSSASSTACFRKTTRLLLFWPVDKSKGAKTESCAFDKPQLRRRRPFREKPPSPAHDEGLD